MIRFVCAAFLSFWTEGFSGGVITLHLLLSEVEEVNEKPPLSKANLPKSQNGANFLHFYSHIHMYIL